MRSIINKQDIIYIGGGNTKSMLAVWREWKLDQLLVKAYNRGAILCGVSAGAICWFEKGVTDSWASNLSVMDCLGFIGGCCCPHYNGEKIISVYTYESDLGDGWEDEAVHGNPKGKRLEALKMGTNIVLYSLVR